MKKQIKICYPCKKPDLAEIGFFQEVDHPSEGRIRMMACPSEWSAAPPSIRCHVPRLGEHSRELLTEAGYQAAEIDALIAAGVTSEARGTGGDAMSSELLSEMRDHTLWLTIDARGDARVCRETAAWLDREVNR